MKSRANQYVGLLYIAPWILGFLLFQLYPFVTSFVYSFTNYSLTNVPDFVGLKNYIAIFTKDSLFYHSLWITLIYVFISVPMKLCFALFIAVILNRKVKAVGAYRTIYYLPSIFGGSVAIAILWRFLFMREGLLNELLAYAHIPAVDWLGSPDVALFTISLLTVWQFGSPMVLFLAGLQQVPKELYEAARADGATRFRMFCNITIPMITPIIFFNLVMQMVTAFQEFTVAFVVTNGGPINATYLYGLKLYEEAFSFFKMGYASALSWIMFVIIVLFTLLIFKLMKSRIYYEDRGDF